MLSRAESSEARRSAPPLLSQEYRERQYGLPSLAFSSYNVPVPEVPGTPVPGTYPPLFVRE